MSATTVTGKPRRLQRRLAFTKPPRQMISYNPYRNRSELVDTPEWARWIQDIGGDSK